MRDIFIGIDGTTPDPEKNVYFEPWDLKYSFIKMMVENSVAGKDDKIHVAGPNLYGQGTAKAIGEALDFLNRRLATPFGPARIVIAGYSRGAYAALRVAQGLGRVGYKVGFLGLIDVVKCTDDATEDNIAKELMRFKGEQTNLSAALASIENQRRAGNTPVGGGYTDPRLDQIREAMAKDRRNAVAMSSEVNRSSLPNALSAGSGSFAIPANVEAGFHARRDPRVGSRTYPMGHYPLTNLSRSFPERRDFFCTHSAMGGMPFRGDIIQDVTRKTEWAGTRTVGRFIVGQCQKNSVLTTGSPHHPVLDNHAPPRSWFEDGHIRDQYRSYLLNFERSDGSGYDPKYESDLLQEVANIRQKRIYSNSLVDN